MVNLSDMNNAAGIYVAGLKVVQIVIVKTSWKCIQQVC